MARPLVEVFSVEICPNSFPCQLYGDIFIYNDGDDDFEQTYTLYERDYEHPESISKDGQHLLLTGSDVPLSMPNPVITIRLYKAPDESVFVSSTRLLDHNPPNYDQYKSCLFQGDHGYVRLNYIVMTFGVVARVSIKLELDNPSVAEKLEKLNATQSSNFPVYGTIVARYGKTYGSTTCDSPACCFSLLKVLSNETIPFCFSTGDAYLLLTRRLVAVPAYSSLRIEVDLKDGKTDEQFLGGVVVERASFGSPCLNDNKFPAILFSENASLVVRHLHPSLDFVPLCSLFLEDKLASMSLDRKVNLCGWSDRDSLLEVHSVVIGRDIGVDLRVSGWIDVLHTISRVLTIFKRDDEDADELVHGKDLLSITNISTPFDFMMADSFFTLSMLLKDANKNLSISGYVDFHIPMRKSDVKKFDKLLCSVVEGVGGFCAVHYTIFSNAVGVEVKCVVLCKNGVDDANIYGKIVASYDMFNYTIFESDRKYYRRVLFDKSEEDKEIFPRKVAFKKTEGNLMTYSHEPVQAEFSRSYVAMPIGHTLYLHVDLHASSHPGHGRRGSLEHFDDTLQFELGGNSPKKILGEDFDILIAVEMIPKIKWWGR